MLLLLLLLLHPHLCSLVLSFSLCSQYFYGANNSLQQAGVQYILDAVVESLLAHPDRKFIYVEQAFFQRWWRQQTEEQKQNVKKLIQKGQFEFVNGKEQEKRRKKDRK